MVRGHKIPQAGPGISLSVFYKQTLNCGFSNRLRWGCRKMRGRVNTASVPQRRLTARPGLLPLESWADCKKKFRFAIGL